MTRFIRWRRTSHAWRYALLALAWAALTLAVWEWAGRRWTVWPVSGALFVLCFEVGLSTIVGYAWLSTGQLEAEDASLSAEVLRLLEEGTPIEEVAEMARLSYTEVHAISQHSRLRLDRRRVSRSD